MAEITNNFDTDDTLLAYEELGGSYDHKVIRFKIAPGEEVNCGMAISELNNDLPFRTLKVYIGLDSIVANSEKEVIDLFDRSWFGGLKKPYCIIIR